VPVGQPGGEWDSVGIFAADEAAVRDVTANENIGELKKKKRGGNSIKKRVINKAHPACWNTGHT
jgi:hypothetical protein